MAPQLFAAGGSAGMDASLKVFSLKGSESLGAAIATNIECALSPYEERNFEDGEHKTRPLESVAGADAYVICSLHGEQNRSPGEKLLRLLFFCGALKDAGAARVTVVAPYLCYSRKDRRTKWNDPVSTRYVAQLLEAMAVDQLVTLDAHNDAAFENAFRGRSVALTAAPLFADCVIAQIGRAELVAMSPDTGGVKRAERFRATLEARIGAPVGFALMEKYRSEGVVTGSLFAGNVASKTVLILDDLISTGHTMARAARAAKAAGAQNIHLFATHGLFTQDSENVLGDPLIQTVTITDSVPPSQAILGTLQLKMHIASAAPLLGAAIRRLHGGGTLQDLAAL